MVNDIDSVVKALKSGQTSSVALVKKSVDTYEADKKSALPLNAFLEIYDDVISLADAADKEIAQARDAGSDAVDALFAMKPLLGITFSVKDNISVKGKHLTCSS